MDAGELELIEQGRKVGHPVRWLHHAHVRAGPKPARVRHDDTVPDGVLLHIGNPRFRAVESGRRQKHERRAAPDLFIVV